MMKDKIIRVEARGEAEMPLKPFMLANLDWLKGNKANSLLTHEQVMINGNVVTQYNTPVQPGDVVEINMTRPFARFHHPRMEMVYEDDDIIVANKGYGILSVGTGGPKKEETAYGILKNYLKNIDPLNKIFIVHRLDRDTSGLMMFAKNPQAKDAMQHNWNNMVLERKYVAVVEGILREDSGTVKSYLGETSQHEVYSSQNPEEGKLAITHFRVLARGNGYTLVEFSLATGRKNQIRVHCKELGHPIVGDRKYGAVASPIGRLALHARTLHFAHPRTRREMNFETPVPVKFKKLIN
jgi:23S rRNA pseudouridine1911/1915/1917 synthase